VFGRLTRQVVGIRVMAQVSLTDPG
jgi:hypothetical protein